MQELTKVTLRNQLFADPNPKVSSSGTQNGVMKDKLETGAEGLLKQHEEEEPIKEVCANETLVDEVKAHVQQLQSDLLALHDRFLDVSTKTVDLRYRLSQSFKGSKLLQSQMQILMQFFQRLQSDSFSDHSEDLELGNESWSDGSFDNETQTFSTEFQSQIVAVNKIYNLLDSLCLTHGQTPKTDSRCFTELRKMDHFNEDFGQNTTNTIPKKRCQQRIEWVTDEKTHKYLQTLADDRSEGIVFAEHMDKEHIVPTDESRALISQLRAELKTTKFKLKAAKKQLHIDAQRKKQMQMETVKHLSETNYILQKAESLMQKASGRKKR